MHFHHDWMSMIYLTSSSSEYFFLCCCLEEWLNPKQRAERTNHCPRRHIDTVWILEVHTSCRLHRFDIAAMGKHKPGRTVRERLNFYALALFSLHRPNKKMWCQLNVVKCAARALIGARAASRDNGTDLFSGQRRSKARWVRWWVQLEPDWRLPGGRGVRCERAGRQSIGCVCPPGVWASCTAGLWWWGKAFRMCTVEQLRRSLAWTHRRAQSRDRWCCRPWWQWRHTTTSRTWLRIQTRRPGSEKRHFATF